MLHLLVFLLLDSRQGRRCPPEIVVWISELVVRLLRASKRHWRSQLTLNIAETLGLAGAEMVRCWVLLGAISVLLFESILHVLQILDIFLVHSLLHACLRRV